MADEGNTTRQASADGESGVHRLRDIVVEEVSLVDRAANKRRFLVVKRSGEMADGKSKDRGKPQDGSAEARRREADKRAKPKQDGDVDKARSRVMRAASEEDNEEDETEKARRSRSAPGDDGDEGDDETDAAKAAFQDDEEEDEDDEDDTKAKKTRTRAKRGANDDGNTPGGTRQGRGGKPAEKADDNDDLVLPSAVKNAVLRVLAQALERLMAVANQVKDADELDDDTDANVPDDLTDELEDIGELLEDIGDQLAEPAEKADGKKPSAAKRRAAKADVAKAGARMAKDRLDRFQKALELLSSVLKELTEAKAPADPSAGSAENPLAKRDGAPGLGELAAGIRELTRVVKHQEERLVQLQKTRATSNAIPVDGGRRREPQDVSWPLDMNRPISRDSVAKAVSFYE